MLVGFPAADGALPLIWIALLPAPLLCRMASLPEIDYVGAIPLRTPRKIAKERLAAEYKIVQHGCDWEDAYREAACEYFYEKENRVCYGKPFYLEGNEEKKQDAMLREKRGVGKEHREIDVGGTVYDDLAPGKVKDEGAYHRNHNAGEIVNQEAPLAPLHFQSAPDEIVEVQKQRESDEASCIGNENKRKYTPDLPAENLGGIQRKKSDKLVCRVHHGEKEHDRVSDYDVKHQISDAEAGMPLTETVYCTVYSFQILSSRIFLNK